MSSETYYDYSSKLSLASVDSESDQLDLQREIESMSGGLPSTIAATVVRLLGNFVEPQNLGWVFGADGEFKWPGLDTPRKPDASFVALSRLEYPDPDAIPVAPDLAVEVFSKTDSVYEMNSKVQEYLNAGVKAVWVINPTTRTVEVHRTNQNVAILNENDELDGSDFLPGFKLRVRDIFSRIPDKAALLKTSSKPKFSKQE